MMQWTFSAATLMGNLFRVSRRERKKMEVRDE